MSKSFLIFLLCSFSFCASAQRSLLAKRVTTHHDDVLLETVLIDISEKNNFSFAYSKDMVSLDGVVSIHANNQPLRKVLNELLQDTAIEYRQIGQQVVLKIDQPKLTQTSKKKPKRKKRKQKKEVITIVRKVDKVNAPVIVPEAIGYTRIKQIPIKGSVIYVDEKLKVPEAKLMKYETRPTWEELMDQNAKVVVSVVNKVSTDRIITTDSTVNLSINIISGSAPNVDGAQIGSISNVIDHDLRGMQVAFIRNKVGEDMMGTQIAGITNAAGGSGYGAQITFGVNRIFTMKGAQIAGLGNKSFENADIQLSLIRNAAKNTKFQFGAFNKTSEKAKFQIGLINRADTISGVGIGLLNFVRHGNNYLEYSRTPLFKNNFALKFGGHQFYNILKGSFDKDLDFFGIGYGIGNTSKITERLSLGVEIIGQILLADSEDNQVLAPNFLTNLNLDLDIILTKWLHIFGGIRMNGTFLETQNEDLTYKFALAPGNVLHDKKVGDQNLDFKLWIGFQYGIRVYFLR